MSGSKTVRIVVITAVFVGIVAVFQSYVMLNVAPDPSRWAIFYAWDPSTQALVQPLSGEGAYQSFVLKSWLDAKIPFVPILSLPYVSFLIIVPFVVPALNLIAGSMRRFLTVGLALIISQLFLNVAYWLFQSNVPRTAELPDGFFGWTVGMVWGNDQPFNAFPRSLHLGHDRNSVTVETSFTVPENRMDSHALAGISFPRNSDAPTTFPH